MGLYVALRREVRRNYELLEKDISHVGDRFGYLDTRFESLDTRFESLDTRFEYLDGRFGRLEEGLAEVRADIRRLDQKIDSVRGELIGFLGPR
jgi:chromosome segregation ATPase